MDRPVGHRLHEPAAGAALARGHGGERVKALQQLLNAAGIKPPLDADGLLGPKTEAALQRLTGSATFDAKVEAALTKLATAGRDGFDTQPAPRLSSPALSAVQVTATTTSSPPPSGSVAEKTLAIAQQELGSINPMQTGPDGK
ncbi:MAG: peptidoglycan-binding domain-containing protein [Myxococcota bacterium]